MNKCTLNLVWALFKNALQHIHSILAKSQCLFLSWKATERWKKPHVPKLAQDIFPKPMFSFPSRSTVPLPYS